MEIVRRIRLTLHVVSVRGRVDLRHIQPGKPTENGHVESFHGRLRDEYLNTNWFWNLLDAGRRITAWRREYNEEGRTAVWDIVRPRSSLQS
jgi:transposase InsO family protein